MNTLGKITMLLLGGAFLLTSCNSNPDISEAKLGETQLDSVSYGIGVFLSSQVNLKAFKDTEAINYALIAKGLYDGTKGEEFLAISNEDASTVINEYLQSLQEDENKENETKYAANVAAGEAFLEENKAKDNIVTLQSGLQYEVIKEGTGATPKVTDAVSVHYTGTLIDGTVFDSSIERGQPINFGVTEVIKGWTEALQLMPVGSKWKIYIPQDLAYGAQGRLPSIEPYSALVFEMELLDIVDPGTLAR